MLIHIKVAKAQRLKKAANRELMLARLRKQHHSLKIRKAEASEEASDTATGTIAEVLLEIKAEHGHSDSANKPLRLMISLYRIRSLGGHIWQDNTKGSDSPSVSGQVLNEYLFGGPTRDEVINVYFHIINKLDCCGVHKFSQPGIFLRTEVAMHVLNKMQEYGKNNPVTADFVKDVAFGSASIREAAAICNALATRPDSEFVRMRRLERLASCWLLERLASFELLAARELASSELLATQRGGELKGEIDKMET
uniref:Uncharacterized protein n=1 Tax=Ananas comosus var. bracteatus TaxID=296719 RepID=A0A6V7PY34_ANACO|nr:unnamed protein product [Ananas comosus var. bracteatus]